MPESLVPHRAARIAGVRFTLAAGCFVIALHLTAGCAATLRFPTAPLAVHPAETGLVKAYDTDGNKQADYFTIENAAGRIVRIAYDLNADGQPDSFVDLDNIDVTQCRHVVFILDGIGYETIEAFQREGGLRLFHPPARVVSTFPPMTDLALADVFQSVRCSANEVVYFDHKVNRLVGSDADYLSLVNEDWAHYTDYRAATIVDPLAYLFPSYYFDQETGDVLKLFDQRDRPRLVAYLVSTAGFGTKELLDGQLKVLRRIDRMSEQLVWKTRGLVKITLLSDHGHALVRCKWMDFGKFLRGKGWNVRDRLGGPRDVVPVEYGLVTYASFAVRDRAALATTLVENEGVDVVAYDDGDAVTVETADGKALIERRGNRYRYRPVKGDPLQLLPVIEKAKEGASASAPAVFDAEGFADDRDWLRMTFTHVYPDALDRLWRSYHGQTENVPDVIASLKAGYCSALASRAARFPEGASTHGDLARKNSTAFVISTTCPIAPRWPYLRCRDLPEVLSKVTGRPWPPPQKGSGQ